MSTYQVQGTVRCHKRYRVTIGSLPTRSSQSRGRQHSTQLAAATPAGEARARSETPSAVGVTEYHRAASVQGTRLRAGPLRRRAVGQRAVSRREISTDRAPGNPDLGGG